jgi:hypothetical protein
MERIPRKLKKRLKEACSVNGTWEHSEIRVYSITKDVLKVERNAEGRHPMPHIPGCMVISFRLGA